MSLLFTFLEMIVAGIILTWIFEFVLKTNKKLRARYYSKNGILFGYHLHHSMYGVGLLVVSIITLLMHNVALATVYLGIALGIIIMHTISDGRFVFIEKQRV